MPAFAEQWRVDPFAAEIVDGYLYGRGTVDMKDFDAILLSVVRARQRAGAIPDRPITLVFTADEEAGSLLGAHWLVEHRPELFEGITEAVGEVGGFSVPVAGRRLYLIQSGEKGMAWLRLTARGTQGHGSMANPDNAVNHLARALVSLADHAVARGRRSVHGTAAGQGARAHRSDSSIARRCSSISGRRPG